MRTLFIVLLACISLVRAEAAAKPNIVVILADDMGFADIGCYGGEVQTPNLDKLASNGLRFTQFYNTARCCPTRASLLTGVYPHQAGIPHMVDNLRLPLDKRQVSRSVVTIAEVLRSAGYKTGMSGKWHVAPVPACETNGPMQRGFERYYGILHGASSFYEPVTLMRDNEQVRPEGTNFFLTDAIAENAVAQMKEFSGAGKPFFLYVAFTAPHWPLHAPREDLLKYTNLYSRGWDVLRKERHERQKKMGLVDRNSVLSERDANVPAWETAPNKDWEAWRMAVYAAQIERMDTGIGRIVEQLRALSQLENTLLMFMSDNGACAEILGSRQNALHVPKKAPDGGPMRLGSTPDIYPGEADTYASYGVGWANLGNTPFRSYKHWVHEGGISTPLIVHWPAQIRKAGLRKEPSHLIDIMPTCVEAGGADYPSTYAGNSIQPMEGKSLLPVFAGKGLKQRHLFWEHEGNRAVRAGDWKLVSRFPDDWELYNLKKDRSETRNTASKNPKKVDELSRVYEDWAKRAHVPDWATVQKSPVLK